MIKTQAIIVMGGTGARMQSDTPKQFLPIHGRPLAAYTLEAFERCAAVDSLIVVIAEGYQKQLESLVTKEGFSKIKQVVLGGKQRSDSVMHGLKALDEDAQIVAIHDGVRPCIKPEQISDLIDACKETDAVILGMPLKSTVKRVDPQSQTIAATMDRSLLWEAQTPQVFKVALIKQAYDQAQGQCFTDDAAYIEAMNTAVKIMEGSYQNIKITTPDDLVVAAGFLTRI